MSQLQTSNTYALPLELPAHHGGVYYRNLVPEDDQLLLEDWKTVNEHEKAFQKVVKTNPKCMLFVFVIISRQIDADEKWILSEIQKRYITKEYV